ncbi:MAG: metallophosphoesterase, partial [Fervidobacterium sp.]
MLIAATSDIHSPRNFEFFVRAVDSMQSLPDIFFLAGDIIDRGDVDEYSKINNTLFGKFNCPIIACFGNSEYGKENTDRIKERYKEITFLEDEGITLDIKDKKVG